MPRYWQVIIMTDDIIDYVGILAQLDLTEEEKNIAKADMTKMLDYIDKLNELNTDNIEPMTHVFEMNNVFREDVVVNGDNSEDMLENAPFKKSNTKFRLVRISNSYPINLQSLLLHHSMNSERKKKS